MHESQADNHTVQVRASEPRKNIQSTGIAALRAARARRLHRAAIAGPLLMTLAGACTYLASRPEKVQVVVTSRMLASTTVLTAHDVRLRAVSKNELPESPVMSLESAIGARLSGAASTGEILTTERLAQRKTPRGDVLVVGFSVDAATASLLHSDDVVDVFATTEGAASADAVGRGLVVAGVVAASDETSPERMVYLRVPAPQAPELLAAKAHRAISLAVRQD